MDMTRKAARHAYEWGRLKHSAQRACFVLPAGLAAFSVGADLGTSIGMAAAMYIIATVGGWWRTSFGEGALAGSATIFIPTALALIIQGLNGMTTPQQCAQICLFGSASLGAIAGYDLGRSAGLRSRADGSLFGGAALTTAAFGTTVGCTALGFGSLFGLATGLLLVGLPTFVVARRLRPVVS